MTDKNDREIMQQALYAMMDAMRVSGGISDKMFESVNAISERLAQQEQERREWKRLTDEEYNRLVMEHLGPRALTGGKMSVYDAFLLAIRVTEAKLKEKNT